jgi:hypothetical protein
MASPHVTTTPSTKQKYVGRLDTPAGVRLELARLYTECRRGQEDTRTGYTLALMLGQLLKAMETSELADRLEALEAGAAQHTPPHLRRLG